MRTLTVITAIIIAFLISGCNPIVFLAKSDNNEQHSHVILGIRG